MIRIDQRAPVSGAGPASSARRASGASFALPTAESETPTRSAGVAAAGPLDTLLAVQADEDQQDLARRRVDHFAQVIDGKVGKAAPQCGAGPQEARGQHLGTRHTIDRIGDSPHL